MSAEEIASLGEKVKDTIADIMSVDREVKSQLERQLRKLEEQEERLIDFAADGTVSSDVLRDKIQKVNLQKQAVSERLGVTTERLQFGAEKALEYLELLKNPGELYNQAPENVRRELLLAFFKRLFVYVENDHVRVEGERNATNTIVRSVGDALGRTEDEKSSRAKAGTYLELRTNVSPFDVGLSKPTMAGVPGLEPRLSEPESLVLPITPYPKGYHSPA